LIGSYQGRSDFLPQTVAVQMMAEVWPSIHGLGTRLGSEGAARVFNHGGANDSYRAWNRSGGIGHLGADFAFDSLAVEVVDGAIKITEPVEEPETIELWPLSPSRFVRPGDFDPLRYEFHRNAHGTVHLLTVQRGSSRLYYRRASP
jgi:hypothetical protein